MTVNGDSAPEYTGGTGPEDFMQADEPPGGDETAGQDFAEGEAPFGWMRDRKTGELRARKRPGRPVVPPGPDELAAAEPAAREPDRPPVQPDRRDQPHPPPPAEIPMPKGGIIAAGVDKLYRRAGKLLRALDHDIGQAIIECTRTELLEEGEVTVGQAWEQIAKTNPRIRAFLVKAIAGGAWGDLVMAHAPLGIAIVMKPAIQRLIPFGRIIESMAEPDEDTPDGEGGLPGGMTAADYEQLKDMAGEQAARMAQRMTGLSGDELADAVAEAKSKLSTLPPGLQPNRQQRRAAASRARRTGGK